MVHRMTLVRSCIQWSVVNDLGGTILGMTVECRCETGGNHTFLLHRDLKTSQIWFSAELQSSGISQALTAQVGKLSTLVYFVPGRLAQPKLARRLF